MQAYCVKCRTKREIQDPKSITEEWQAGYSGNMSNMRHEDVQNWKGITLLV